MTNRTDNRSPHSASGAARLRAVTWVVLAIVVAGAAAVGVSALRGCRPAPAPEPEPAPLPPGEATRRLVRELGRERMEDPVYMGRLQELDDRIKELASARRSAAADFKAWADQWLPGHPETMALSAEIVSLQTNLAAAAAEVAKARKALEATPSSDRGAWEDSRANLEAAQRKAADVQDGIQSLVGRLESMMRQDPEGARLLDARDAAEKELAETRRLVGATIGARIRQQNEEHAAEDAALRKADFEKRVAEGTLKRPVPKTRSDTNAVARPRLPHELHSTNAPSPRPAPPWVRPAASPSSSPPPAGAPDRASPPAPPPSAGVRGQAPDPLVKNP